MTDLLGMALLAGLPVLIVLGAAVTFVVETADLRREAEKAKEDARAARAAARVSRR